MENLLGRVNNDHELISEKKKMINKLLKEYDDESFVWILDLLISHFRLEGHLLSFLVKYPDIKYVKDLVIKKLIKYGDSDVVDFINYCNDQIFKYISPSQISHIKNNSRLNWWAINEIIYRYEIRPERDFKQLKNPYLFLLYLIYSKVARTEENLTQDIQNLDRGFNKITSNKINLNKYMDDTKFQEWAYHYIRNKFRPRNHPSFTPQNNEEYKDYILGYFDAEYFYNKSKYENDINKLKKAWQQKVYRDKGNTKKTYHLPLTQKAKTELAKLAKYKNQSENSVLEDLIHNAFITEICGEDGREKY